MASSRKTLPVEVAFAWTQAPVGLDAIARQTGLIVTLIFLVGSIMWKSVEALTGCFIGLFIVGAGYIASSMQGARFVLTPHAFCFHSRGHNLSIPWEEVLKVRTYESPQQCLAIWGQGKKSISASYYQLPEYDEVARLTILLLAALSDKHREHILLAEASTWKGAPLPQDWESSQPMDLAVRAYVRETFPTIR